MQRYDYRDMIGGGLLVAFGLWVAWQAGAQLDIGSARRMGPGFFPLVIGCILAGLGLLVLIGGLLRPGNLPQVDLRAMLAVLASMLIFALLLVPFGLLPAVAGLVTVASLADRAVRLVPVAALTAVLCTVAYLVFSLGLGMPLTMIRWPV